MRPRPMIVILSFSLLILPFAGQATTWLVNPDGSGDLPTIADCLAAAACGGESGDDVRDLGELSFNVDSTLLGERFLFPRGDLSLRAPMGWDRAPDSLLARAGEALRARQLHGERLAPDLLALFRQPEHGGLLSISHYPGALSPADGDSIYLLQYEGVVRIHGEAAVSRARFTHGDLELGQLYLDAEQSVTFKLFLQQSELDLFQLDYVIPRSVYETEARLLESSIGSIGSIGSK